MMKQRFISALLRIYPAAWRVEYGPELHELLLASRLRTRTVADVVWNGARQRLRATEPWVLLGLPFALLSTLVYVVLILAPPPFAPRADGSWLLGLLINLSLPLSCGHWTVVRSAGTLPHAGLQATKMALLISAPHFIVYTLVIAGALGVVVIGPGHTPTTFAEHGFTLAFYRAGPGLPVDVTFVGMFVARLFGLFQCWLLGMIGGIFGRSIRNKLQATH